MAVRISGNFSPSNLGRPSRLEGKKADEKATLRAEHSAAEKVELAHEEAASVVRASEPGGVDTARIAQLRAAIANGTYEADLKSVAERIIREAALLNG
ncbi:flagellar biosynthesis anti-sigma factor FlgM [Myxococcota bacterium]|nr:flagellar biosynthesis anti-sigma factor FlgM [Myxococcota bacterium]MBU1429379.1 flagellar biosynthesis anti-sigma factor FlgM [Myxococcota bacterium]MBU1899246.1 flagellar biosynthesis anti-sigma factor FlgM [Myxococcota bacterium]